MNRALLADWAALYQLLRIDQARESLREMLLESGPTILSRGAAAFAIFMIGKWASGLAENLTDRVLKQARIDETLRKFLCRLVNAVIMCAVVLAALEKLGVNTTSLAAVFAAAGLAIGLALQGSLSNFAAGVMIILFRPFKVGDVVEAAGTKGIVEEIHIFSTMMRTGDNVKIIVPNSSVTSSNITNYSSMPTRRIDLVIGCGYQDDLRAVKSFLEAVIAAEPRVLAQPEPVVAVSDLADHSVQFVVRPWVKNADYWTVRWALVEQIKLGFDEHGFHIPFPQRDIHVHHVERSVADAAEPEPMTDDLPVTQIQPRRVA